MRNQTANRFGVPCVVGLGVLGAAAPACLAQELSMSPPPSHQVASGADSGWAVHTGSAGGEIVWSTVVFEPDARWMRLAFSSMALWGDPARDDATIIRMTSLDDGAVQVHNAETLGMWSGTSAYFNGDAVLVELIAFPGSGPSRVVIGSATAGDAPFGGRTICGPTDDRVLSSSARDARYLPSGCSAWIISDATHQFLTAGHCGVDSAGVVEFNVPLSGSDGSLRHPGPEDQYAVEPTSIQTTYIGVGDDFSYFGCWPNTTTNQAAYQRQNDFYPLAPSVAAPNGDVLRITGYGTTSAPVSNTWNQVQKTHTGAYIQRSGTTLRYTVDTTGGNSGSPIFNQTTGLAIGIHTNGGCSSGGGSNSGTSLDNAALRSALANPRGICAPGFGQIVPPVFAAGDSNRVMGTVSYQNGTFTRLSTLNIGVEGMAYDWNRNVFWITSTDNTLYRADAQTGAKTLVGTLGGVVRSPSGLAYDPWTDTLYGVMQTGGRLVRIDTTTAVVTALGAPGGNNVGALDYDPFTRTIYGIDDAAGGSRLVRIDAVTGLQTVIGALGAGITDCNGLGFRGEDRQLYTINASTEQLLRVNPATGTATVVGGTGALWGSAYGLACIIARPCDGDYNGDGFVDFFDVDSFIDCFEGGACPPGKSADFNGDGFVDFFDLDAFIEAFEAGC